MSVPFTKFFGERILAVKTDIKVSKAYDAQRMAGVQHPPYESCNAIWDTGAMNTVITMCDFALTNRDGLSVFSFDIPSSHVTDYTVN